MNRETDSEIIKRTFWLLRRIKRFFQTFKFKEDDLQMVYDWAEILAPVIDWCPQGLTDYCRVKTDTRKKEPSVSDIYEFSYLAKTAAERVKTDEAKEEQSSYSADFDRVARLIDRKREEFGIVKEKPLPPADRAAMRKKQIEAAQHLSRQNLPFVPDEEELPK